ncbi:protein transport protein S31 [Allomyces javanicus]|nr:protein transport protein S31 [Allomyces javanicus]
MTRKTLSRTATLTWSPAFPHLSSFPQYIATGSVAGALDASFSSQSALELFEVPFDASHELRPVASVPSSARFNRLAWTNFCTDAAPNGILAAGLENGELALYNPHALLHGPDGGADDIDATRPDPVLFRSTSHTAAVRGLDFNAIQPNLLGTGAGEGEILIWDMNNPATPYSPGPTKSPRLAGSEVNCLAWNRSVPHILATSSSNGITVVWDLKNRREVFSLAAPTSAPGGMWNAAGSSAAAGGRRQGVVVAWHPDVPTQFVTALEDDANPVILMWDLRNATAPLRTMQGHTKGILSVAWCPKDSDLLLSCGKDNRTLCWNPAQGEIIGELPHANNWCFDVQWCARNPDLLSVASFDGSVTVQSLLPSEPAPPASPTTVANDPFAAIAPAATSVASTIALKQPPKWMRRPCSVAFGFGGRLAHVTAKNQSQVVVKQITGKIAEQANELQQALAGNTQAKLAQTRVEEEGNPKRKLTWTVIQSLFESEQGRATLVRLLDDELRAHQVALVPPYTSPEDAAAAAAAADAAAAAAAADSAAALAAAFDGIDGVTAPVEGAEGAEGEDKKPAEAPATEEAKPAAPPTALAIPADATDADDGTLIQAVLHGDYTEAVHAALAQHRFSEALILAACGGHDLFVKTRDAYLARHPAALHALIATVVAGRWNDLLVTQFDWRQILIVVLTYCKGDELIDLAGKLGDQLLQRGEELGAVISFLLSGRLEQLVQIWAQHMAEDTVSSPVLQAAATWGPKCDERAQLLHHVIEQTSLVMAAVGVSQLPKALLAVFAEYANVVALVGDLPVAWKYLTQLPASPAAEGVPERTCTAIQLLKHRVHGALPRASQVADAPALPYEVVDVNGPLLAPAVPEPVQQQQQPVAQPQQQPTQAYPGAPQTSYYGNGYNPYAPAPAAQQQPVNPYAPVPAQQPYGAVPPQPYNPYAPAAAAPAPPTPLGGFMVPPPTAAATAIPTPNPYATMGAMAGALPNAPIPPPPRNATPPAPHSGWNDAPPAAARALTPATKPLAPPPAPVPAPFPNGGGAYNPYATSAQGPYGAPQTPTHATVQAMPLPPPPPATAAPPHAAFAPQQQGRMSVPPQAASPVHHLPPPPAVGNVAVPPPPLHMQPHMQPQQQQQQQQQGYAGVPPPMGGAPRPPSAAPAPRPPSAAPPAAAAAPPPGDRSRITAENMPVFTVLNNALQRAKAGSAPAQRRLVEDVDRRMNQLFDALNAGTLAEGVVAALHTYARAVEQRDWATAVRVHQELSVSQFDAWMIGLKRLVDLVAKMP